TATTLAGRPLAEWSDSDLEDFCRRYNVGFVACWTPKVADRFRRWPLTELLTPVHDRGDGWLFAIKRQPSYVLKGKAKIIQMDETRIALADVEPEDGELVLSLHYQNRFRVAPGAVKIERDTDAYDPIPFVRLRLSKPMLRVTLMWGE